jgi:hypothetical protein
MAKILDLEKARRIQPGQVCWNCKYYIRPGELMIDGPVSSICIIDRESGMYPNSMYINPGDIKKRPGDSCDRFALSGDVPK